MSEEGNWENQTIDGRIILKLILKQVEASV
jgi:hypothetical protein